MVVRVGCSFRTPARERTREKVRAIRIGSQRLSGGMTCFFAGPALLVPGRALADSGIPSDVAGNTDGGG
jgi:hypothetical protein